MIAIQVKKNDKFGSLTVISDVYRFKNLRTVDVQCKCGKILQRHCHDLKKYNKCIYCSGKDKHKFKIGNRYGNLTVIGYNESKPGKVTKIKVKCICNNEFLAYPSTLGKNKNCAKCLVHKNGSSHPSYKGLKYISRTHYSHIKSHAKWSKRKFNLSIEYLNNLLIQQKHKCVLSGLPIKISNTRNRKSTTASLDRIDSSKGYIEGNVQWVHKRINSMKSNQTDKEFIEYCKLVAFNN